MTIRDIEIVGNNQVPNPEIVDLIERDLVGSTWFINNRNMFFPRYKLAELIQKKYGFIDVFFSTKDNTLILNIIERPPIAYMCPGEYLYMAPDTVCSWLSRDGSVYGSTLVSSTSLPLIFSQRLSTTTQEFTKQVADIISIVEKNWSEISLINLYDRHLDVDTMYGSLLIPYSHDLEYITNILIHMGKASDQNIRKGFEYIDMRHGTTLYFKRLDTAVVQDL